MLELDTADLCAAESVIRRIRDARTRQQLIGDTPGFCAIIDKLPATSDCDAPVLITGETGTGKELVARAIHYLSPRAPHPFLAIKCGAIPDALLEEEFFGHERGSFTDAHVARRGLLAQAERGTFFLDEIDALSLRAQVSLLRVLQDRTFRAIGSSQERRADVRVITATNADVEELVRQGRFRADLYYRICVFSIHLPALRDRTPDIPLLVRHFLEKHAGDRVCRLTPAAERAVQECRWPGNVRELENRILRGIHLSREGQVDACDMGLEASPAAPSPQSAFSGLRRLKQTMIETFERDYLTRLMRDHGGNVTSAARFAGKERREFGKLLKKYGLDSKKISVHGNVAAGGCV